MARVVLVRHGVTGATGTRLGGRTPAPLSEDGRTQAGAVASRLAGSGTTFAGVHSSPVVRALETAQPIGGALDLEVEELPGVAEFDYGDWTDRTLKQVRRTKAWRWVQATPSRFTFPDGESFPQAQLRAVTAIEELVGHYTDRQSVVVVSHADVIKALVAHYAGIPLDLFQRLVISPASLTVLAVPREGVPRLLTMNDTAHLAA